MVGNPSRELDSRIKRLMRVFSRAIKKSPIIYSLQTRSSYLKSGFRQWPDRCRFAIPDHPDRAFGTASPPFQGGEFIADSHFPSLQRRGGRVEDAVGVVRVAQRFLAKDLRRHSQYQRSLSCLMPGGKMHRKRHFLLSFILILVASVAVRADDIDDYLKG